MDWTGLDRTHNLFGSTFIIFMDPNVVGWNRKKTDWPDMLCAN